MSTAVVVRAPAGLGKTTQVVDAIAQRNGGRVEIYAPTHALAKELAGIARAANPELRVQVIAGRSHEGVNGKPLCKKHKLAEEVARAGGEVYSSLCARKRGKEEERCQYYEACPYITQFTAAQVTIYPHAYLPLERMRLEPGVPELAIIDESFFESCIEIFDVPLSLLRADFLGPLSSRVCAEIEHALTHGFPLFTHLYSVEIYWIEVLAAIKEVRKGAPPMHPRMSAAAREAVLQVLRRTSQVEKLLQVVYRESGVGRRGSHGLKYYPDTQTIKVHARKSIVRFGDRQHNEARVLVIDANANEEIISQFFDVAELVTIQAARQAEVIQCRSTRCSTTSLVPRRNTDQTSKREAKRRLTELERFVGKIAEHHRRALVVGPQVITGNPRAKAKPLIKVAANVDLAHFQAIRGIDGWKDHDAIVVIGRNEPPIEAVEGIARCVFLSDRAPLQFAAGWTVEERGYRLKTGQFGVGVVRHPDARVQMILEQLREGESQQAIDRLRLVHAAEPKRVYVLSNVVLDIDVDHLVTWDEMMNGGGRIEQAWNRVEGVMPLAPAWLATRFPRLWKTVDAAKVDAAGVAKECRFTNIFNIRNSTLFKHQYRPVPTRQRVWSVCLSVHADPEVTRLALEALLAGKVEMRDLGTAAAGPKPRPRRRTKSSSEVLSASPLALGPTADPPRPPATATN